MATFDVVGPLIVPTQRRRTGARVVDVDALEQFWEAAACRDRPGCYVFAVRHGRGALPYYAGRTLSRLDRECFQLHKLRKYDGVLSDILRGTPVMFLLPLVQTRGRVNGVAIESLEDTLIKMGLERNPKMTNISGTRRLEIVVRGVWDNGRRGRPSAAAALFADAMGI